ncbi:large ribosomal subunit protein bL28m-like [Haliotis cracherodii]|uniref:large ribosomal subunit protein bL28m-like n=1 Tax=Haliotis cracherodii TaxID=6455 RepID=UPI0039ED28C9
MSARIHKFRNAAYKYVLSKEAHQLLPAHYKRRCMEFMQGEPTAVHWQPEQGPFKLNPNTGKRERVQNVPVKVVYPEECNKGLWGGEGLVVGYRKSDRRFASRIPKIWRPYLTKRVLYSEILDKYFEIQVTLRTLDLIDEVYGFDHYILKTSEVDLNSQLAMKLKREMLLALVQKTLYPEDPKTREKVHNKYKQYLMPEEEAEWVGLTLGQAMHKARDKHAKENPTRPLKEVFTQQFIQDLSEGTAEHQTEDSWMSKLNPFGSKTSSKS